MKKIMMIHFLLLVTIGSIAQTSRNTTKEDQLWMGYFNQSRLTNKWGIWFDAHYRLKDHFFNEPSKLLTRLGIMYYVHDDFKVTNAYNFTLHYPEDGHQHISQPEHRIWHQLQLHTRYGKIRTMQWLRLEERFRRKIKNDFELSDGFRFDERLRYNLLVTIPTSKKGIAAKTFSAILNNEIMVNLTRKNVYNIFDQNRFFIGLAYNFDSHSNLQFGYMNVYQQLSNGYSYKNIHALRVFFFQNLDLRRKENGTLSK